MKVTYFGLIAPVLGLFARETSPTNLATRCIWWLDRLVCRVPSARDRQGPSAVVMGIIDGDGHFFERDELLYPYFDAQKYPIEGLRRYYLFPDLDGWRREPAVPLPRAGRTGGSALRR